MSLRIGDRAPNFTADSTQGQLHFDEWLGNSWCLLFSHPKDFTPVCTTELGYLARMQYAFAERNCKVLGLSVDPVSDHQKWLADIKEVSGYEVRYPLIGDHDLSISKLYGMLPS
jgi:thioredoxin-dependent peroxiredoxin